MGRCYLRAIFGIATSLWCLNRIEEAATHFETVLQADPADHLFARYWLAVCLLDAGRLEELETLLDRYDDEVTAFWRYAQALWAFAAQGDSDESCQLLKEAHRLDTRFLDYLLGDGMVRADQPIRFERGRNATHSTARLLLPAWRSVPGAATWVRASAPCTARPGRRRVAVSRASNCWICRSKTRPGKSDCGSWTRSRLATILVGFWVSPTCGGSKCVA